VAAARVAGTYSTLNQTFDEPWHLAIGMAHLQFGAYDYEHKHPPLARDLAALGPFLAGVRSAGLLDLSATGLNALYEEGNALLHWDGRYWRNLTLARLGTLPFLVWAVVVAFLWGRRWFSPAAGWWAAALLASTPPVLGHAGVATNDMACAATVAAALYQFLRWIEEPGWKRTVWLGAAVALALLAKLSSIGFLGACFFIGAVCLRSTDFQPVSRYFTQLLLALALALALNWAYYGFTVKTLAEVWGPHPRIDAMLAARPWLQPVWNTATSLPLPLTELITGVRDLNRHNNEGFDSYLLGEYRRTGWWYFFPVVLAVKTPLGLLLLAAAGWIAILARPRSVPLPHLLTALFPAGILGVAMLSRIDLGVRHILPVYPLLAVLAGGALSACAAHRLKFAAAAALAAWTIVEPAFVHPDYIAYFNPLAGRRPERILAESDLDWGQDLARLARRLKERNVPEVSIAYFGSALLDQAGLPPYRALDPHRPAAGYIAVSVRFLTLENARDGSFAWLKGRTPIERVGKSIDLFYLPE
jgi:4-amino-4-deoxy-L-arabinose transferase-like glycosyltransferase